MRSALVLLAFVLAVPASGQSSRGTTSERVVFAPGSYGSTVLHEIGSGQTHRFLVNVRRGQTLRVNLESGGSQNVRLQVYAPGRTITARNAASSADGERFDLEYWTGQLSRSGDDQVVVYPAPGVSHSTYTLSIAAG